MLITVLSREGNGTAAADLLNTVDKALNDESVRPVADRVSVQPATINDYRVQAKLHLFDGVAAAPCLEAANARLAAYLTEQKKLGRGVPRVYGAVLRVASVDWVDITEPAPTSSWTARGRATAPVRTSAWQTTGCWHE